MAIITDILERKIGRKKAKAVEYIVDSFYWLILLYLILSYGFYSNEMCLQAIYEINTECTIFCSHSDIGSLKYANVSGLNITWDSNG